MSIDKNNLIKWLVDGTNKNISINDVRNIVNVICNEQDSHISYEFMINNNTYMDLIIQLYRLSDFEIYETILSKYKSINPKFYIPKFMRDVISTGYIDMYSRAEYDKELLVVMHIVTIEHGVKHGPILHFALPYKDEYFNEVYSDVLIYKYREMYDEMLKTYSYIDIVKLYIDQMTAIESESVTDSDTDVTKNEVDDSDEWFSDDEYFVDDEFFDPPMKSGTELCDEIVDKIEKEIEKYRTSAVETNTNINSTFKDKLERYRISMFGK